MKKVNYFIFTLLYAALTLLAYNIIFFQKLSAVTGVPMSIGISVCLFALLLIAENLLFWRHTTKPVIYFFLFANAIALYFMNTYHISIDKIMLLNVLETDLEEVADLLNIRFISYLIIGGMLPALLVHKLPLTYPSIKQRLLFILGCLGIMLALILPNTKETASFLREHKRLKYDLIPANYIGAVISAHRILNLRSAPLQKIGEDARLVPYWQNNKNNLFVIIIGETARAANFSLYGYERQTDKELLPYSQDLYVYQNATSCGTATAVSLPCIFAPEGRSDFSVRKANNRENLLDILQKSGYDVLWRENNSGCKGICKRIKTEVLSKNYENPDEILLQNFTTLLKPQNQVIVLHQQGSHGPAYFRRYPKEFGLYQPYCTKKDFGKCSQEEIINAYDNSIAYTAHIIAQTIKQLETLTDKYNVALLYVSDHGESLGENGIYLHSAPYALAPAEQTHIPFMLWIPQTTIEALKINREHLKNSLNLPVSHDNVFHTVLGLAGIQTSLYTPEYDLLSSSQN